MRILSLQNKAQLRNLINGVKFVLFAFERAVRFLKPSSTSEFMRNFDWKILCTRV